MFGPTMGRRMRQIHFEMPLRTDESSIVSLLGFTGVVRVLERRVACDSSNRHWFLVL
jgi:hypothetical protein